jgi:hypothetical protein
VCNHACCSLSPVCQSLALVSTTPRVRLPVAWPNVWGFWLSPLAFTCRWCLASPANGGCGGVCCGPISDQLEVKAVVPFGQANVSVAPQGSFPLPFLVPPHLTSPFFCSLYYSASTPLGLVFLSGVGRGGGRVGGGGLPRGPRAHAGADPGGIRRRRFGVFGPGRLPRLLLHRAGRALQFSHFLSTLSLPPLPLKQNFRGENSERSLPRTA